MSSISLSLADQIMGQKRKQKHHSNIVSVFREAAFETRKAWPKNESKTESKTATEILKLIPLP